MPCSEAGRAVDAAGFSLHLRILEATVHDLTPSQARPAGRFRWWLR